MNKLDKYALKCFLTLIGMIGEVFAGIYVFGLIFC